MRLTRGSWFVSLALLLAALLGSSAQAQFSGPALTGKDGVNVPTALTTDPAVLFPPDRDIILQPGDGVRVSLYGFPDYVIPDRVASDGTITLPLAGSVNVQGISRHDAEALIAQRLQDAQMFNHPQVVIDVLETPTQSVTLIGEAHGVIPVLGRKKLYDVIVAAGGFPPTASHIVTIHRPGVINPIVIDLGTDVAQSQLANIPVFAGDTIETSRVGSVYMLGAFRTQTVIPLGGNTPLSLMQAMTAAGGIPFEGKTSDMKIVRTIGTRRSVVNVDLKKIMAGKAPDPVLQSDDIVLLPTSFIRAALRSGAVSSVVGIALALSTTILYASQQ